MALRSVITFGKLSGRTLLPQGQGACINKLLRPHIASAPSLRSYALYKPEDYLQPITDLDTLDEILNDEDEKNRMQFKNIHPTHPYQSLCIFYHPSIIRLCNYVMKEGNKPLARNLIEEAFMRIKRTQLNAFYDAETEEERESIECDPLKIYLSAVENCKPKLDLTSVKKGGITYQVPIPMGDARSFFVANRWLVHAGRDRPHRKVHFPENFAREVIDAHYNRGRVVQQKMDLHKQCEANRAYAQYRWS